jgi:hypothetical protein
MTEEGAPRSPEPIDLLRRLQRVQGERFRELLKRRPGQRRYRRSLRAFLDADANLQNAILARLSPD